ncbi:MAG: hypothetical protein ACLPKE_09540 [Streptosporangiaceae bacterium]
MSRAPSKPALLAWLGYRRATWPDTANRYVLVSRTSALGTRPVSPDYLDKHQPHGISLEHIRRGRILHEALATGADPLRHRHAARNKQESKPSTENGQAVTNHPL